MPVMSVVSFIPGLRVQGLSLLAALLQLVNYARSAACLAAPSRNVLRMTRAELGSYLGLQLETVSRLFSRFQREGLIQIQGCAIKLLDPVALKCLIGQRG